MKTLPKILRNNGYFTGIVGKNHVIEVNGLERPEWLADSNDEIMLEILQRNKKKQDKALREAGFDFSASLYYDNPDFIGVKSLASHNLDWIAQGALQFLEQASKDKKKPFFLYCAATIPHGPGEASRSWNADPKVTAYGMLKKAPTVMPARNTLLPRLAQANIKDKSRANLLWLDDMLGSIVTKLKETGDYENTVFLYFNDHGQKAKGTIYQGGVHSESFIRIPNLHPFPSRSKSRITNLDFTPTLLDICGIDTDSFQFDGRSFLPDLQQIDTQNHSAEHSPLFFELGFVRGIIHGEYKYIALRYPPSISNMSLDKRKKILAKFNQAQERRGRPIYTNDPSTPFSHVQAIPGGGDAEHKSISLYPAFHDIDQLYHLVDDPNEQNNLASSPQHKDQLQFMKSKLQKHLQTMPGSFGEFTHN